MDEIEALAICFQNLKGSKQKDLLKTARALEFLKSLPKYSSNKKAGRAVGVSGEIVREFLVLLKLPSEIYPMFEQNKLGLEQGRKLWQLTNKRPEIVAEAAKSLIGLTTTDTRDLIEYLLYHADATVEEAKLTIVRSHTLIEREFHVVAILSEENYRQLETIAHKQSTAVDEIVTSVINHWLQSEDVTD